ASRPRRRSWRSGRISWWSASASASTAGSARCATSSLCPRARAISGAPSRTAGPRGAWSGPRRRPLLPGRAARPRGRAELARRMHGPPDGSPMSRLRTLAWLLLTPSLLAPGPAAAGPPTAALILSRHSGQVVAGQDFPLPRSKAVDPLADELAIPERPPRALAEAVRIRAELRGWERRTVDGLAIEADADRVQVGD